MSTYDDGIATLMTRGLPNPPYAQLQYAQRHALSRARMQAFVQCEDVAQLREAVENERKEWGTSSLQDLWFTALLLNKPKSFEVLFELAQKKEFQFHAPSVLDAMPEGLQQWALELPKVRTLWLMRSKLFSGQDGIGYRSGLRVLESNASTQALQQRLDARSADFHDAMKTFIAEQGMQALMKNGAFLHTIAYYQAPNKKQLRVAATGAQPVYDFASMEEHWPGIESCVQALVGLGLNSTECEDRLRKMVSNRAAEKSLVQSEQMDLPDNFAGD